MPASDAHMTGINGKMDDGEVGAKYVCKKAWRVQATTQLRRGVELKENGVRVSSIKSISEMQSQLNERKIGKKKHVKFAMIAFTNKKSLHTRAQFWSVSSYDNYKLQYIGTIGTI